MHTPIFLELEINISPSKVIDNVIVSSFSLHMKFDKHCQITNKSPPPKKQTISELYYQHGINGEKK
jgi:hypothetical protein